MRANINSLQRHAEKYLSELEYRQFEKYLEERNSPNISVRMHANIEISRLVKQIRRQAGLNGRGKKIKVTQ